MAGPYHWFLLFATDLRGRGCFSHLFLREEVHRDFDLKQDCFFDPQLAGCFQLLLGWARSDLMS